MDNSVDNSADNVADNIGGIMIEIRKASKKDIASIVELEEATFPIPWDEASIRHDITESDIALVLVAELDGVFAGYADVWEIAGEAQLNNIAVCEAARGKHVGQRLMEALFEKLIEAGDSEISLEVRPSNIAATRLYYKLGFAEAGRREHYYLDNNEDALILKKFF